MPVINRPMVNGAVVDPPRVRRGLGARAVAWVAGLLSGGLRGTWPIGVVLILSGVVGWLAGARFTAVGVPTGTNMVFAGIFGVGLGLPTPSGWGLVAATVVAGAFFSRVEVRHRPFSYTRRDGGRGRWSLSPLSHWVAWLVVITIDVASTFVGVAALVDEPPGRVWAMFLEVARSREYNGLASTVLTFAPEIAIWAGWALLWRPEREE